MKRLLLTISMMASVLAATAKQDIVIAGQLPFLKGTDSVHITVYKYFCFSTVSKFNMVAGGKVQGDRFRITFPATDRPSFVYIDFSRIDKNIRRMLIEPGDNVFITEKNNRYVFSGKNSAKYNLVLGLDSIYFRYHPAIDNSDPNLAANLFLNGDSTALQQLRYLRLHGALISQASYFMLKNNIVANDLFKGSALAYADPVAKSDAAVKSLDGYRADKGLSKTLDSLGNDSLSLYSQFFLRGEMVAYRRDSCFLKGRQFEVGNCYAYLKQHFNGNNRQGLLTWLIYSRKDQPDDLKPLIDDALQFVNIPDFRDLLLELSATRLRGTPAFNFELTDEHGKMRYFSEFKGKVVFLDFWYTGCPSCAETAPILANVESSFAGNDIIFITVCVDMKKDMWLGSVRQKIYTSDHSLNFYTNGKGILDPVIAHYKVTSYPTLILIGKDGKLSETVGDPRLDAGRRLRQLLVAQQ